MTADRDRDDASRAEEARRAALGQEYQDGLDRAGESYDREQARLAEERRAEANMTREREEWQQERAELAREEARAVATGVNVARDADRVKVAEHEALAQVQDRLDTAKDMRRQQEAIQTFRPPSWKQVQAAEEARRMSEEKHMLDWHQKDREGLRRRAGEGNWPEEELIEKLRVQAEIHAKQVEKLVQEQHERLERLRLTNGRIHDDRGRDR